MIQCSVWAAILIYCRYSIFARFIMKGLKPMFMDLCYNNLQDFKLSSWCSYYCQNERKNLKGVMQKKKVVDDKKFTAQLATDPNSFYGGSIYILVICGQFATTPDIPRHSYILEYRLILSTVSMLHLELPHVLLRNFMFSLKIDLLTHYFINRVNNSSHNVLYKNEYILYSFSVRSNTENELLVKKKKTSRKKMLTCI